MHLPEEYFQDGATDILSVMNSKYRECISLHQQYWIQADIDLRFKAGDQSLWDEIYGMMPQQNRRQFNFNKIRRTVNLVSGHQRRTRKTCRVVGMKSEDDSTADQLSRVLQWAMQWDNMYHTISEAFDGALTTGFNLLCPWIDYREDPVSGDIKLMRRDFNGFLIDPNFKDYSLSDASFVWTRRWITIKQAEMLFPGREKEIRSFEKKAYRDDKFQFLPHNFQFTMKGYLSLDEYWYADTRKAKWLIDPYTSESMEWKGDEENLRLYKRSYPDIIIQDHDRPTTRLASVLNGHLMYDGPNPYGIDRYPFVGTFCYLEPEIPYYWWKIAGIPRGMRDAQYLYNRRKLIELDTLESQINSGLKVKEDALIDIKDGYMTGQGRVLVIKKTASLDDVQQLPPPAFDPNSMQISQGLNQEMMDIAGINEELLGSATDDKSGILSMLRQGAGLTTLQKLFDQLDLAQKQLGTIILEMIQANFEPGKIQRILGEEPSPRFTDKAFSKYDCVVEQGMLTETQREMQFRQLMALREMNIPVPSDILLDTLSIEGKSKLMEAIKAQEEAQAQQEQYAQQLQQQQQQVVTESLASKAQSDRALAQERTNKISLDAALSQERIQRAYQERDEASLARIKAAKELVDIDLRQLEKALQIIKSMQETVVEDQKEEAANTTPATNILENEQQQNIPMAQNTEMENVNQENIGI